MSDEYEINLDVAEGARFIAVDEDGEEREHVMLDLFTIDDVEFALVATSVIPLGDRQMLQLKVFKPDYDEDGKTLKGLWPASEEESDLVDAVVTDIVNQRLEKLREQGLLPPEDSPLPEEPTS